MAGILQHLRSSTLDKRPSPGSMVDGQVAINYASGSPGLFFKDNAGALVKVGPVHVGTTAPNVSPASGGTAGNSRGEQWLDTSGGGYVMKIWDGSAWRTEAGEFVNATGDIMTGALGVPPASAGSPTIYFSGDTDTGWYSPGANQLAITTSGTGRLLVDQSGGIKFLSAAIDFSSSLISKTSDSGGLTFAGGTASAQGANIELYGPSAPGLGSLAIVDAEELRVRNAGGASEKLRITSDGKVGIGTSAPSASLSVNATVASYTSPAFNIGEPSIVNGRQLYAGYNTTDGTGFIQAVHWGTSYKPLLLNPNGGDVGVGTSSPGNRLHVSSSGDVARLDSSTTDAGLLFFDSVGGSRIGTRSANIIFDTSSLERVRITSDGKVGIGASAPSTALHVAGSPGSATSGNIYISNLGQARVKLYNGGAVCEWLFGQKTNADNDFKISKLVGTSESDFLTITSDGKVGVGTTSPGVNLEIAGTTPAIRLTETDSTGFSQIYVESAVLSIDVDPTSAAASSAVRFNVDNSERLRIDSSGRLLVGTSTSIVEQYSAQARLQSVTTGSYAFSAFNYTADANECVVTLGKSRSATAGTHTIVQSNDSVGTVRFEASDGVGFLAAASIIAQVDGTPGVNDMPGRLVFSTTADGASGPTERMRIDSKGFAKFSNTGAYAAIDCHQHQADTNEVNTFIHSTNAAYTSHVLQVRTSKAGNSNFALAYFVSSDGADIEFNLRGDGNGYCDGAWTGGGADYAEYFEWSDANPAAEDRRGISVVLDGNKIREAQAGEDPIGVISGNPSVVGDAAWNKWSGKYLRDDYGTYIQEDYEVEDENGNTIIQQRRKLNPAYDPDVEYVSREERPEWDCVGLMGKLRIRKGQTTGSRWIKMRDISATVEEWLVR